MADFLQQVVSGLASGGVYALLALALVLIYRSTGVINFAQGEMAMFSTFICWELTQRDVTYWVAFFLTLAISFAGGVAIERLIIRPVENAPVLTVVTVTIGLLIAFNGLGSWIWGPEVKAFDTPFSNGTTEIGGVVVAYQDLGVLAVVLATFTLLWVFLRFTTIGLVMRAVANSQDASRLLGVRVGWMLALGWGLAAVLGAIAGMMAAPTQFLDSNMMLIILIYSFAAAVLGGIDSPLGAVVGGLILGVLINILGTYVDFIGGELRLPAAFAVLLAVLLVRPQGLFGHRVVRRV
mgnify:CR=1 FL=1